MKLLLDKVDENGLINAILHIQCFHKVQPYKVVLLGSDPFWKLRENLTLLLQFFDSEGVVVTTRQVVPINF